MNTHIIDTYKHISQTRELRCINFLLLSKGIQQNYTISYLVFILLDFVKTNNSTVVYYSKVISYFLLLRIIFTSSYELTQRVFRLHSFQ